MLVCISNAGFRESWQRPIYESIRESEDWYFSRLDGCCASWLDERELSKKRKLIPAPQWERLFGNQWSSGSGDALTSDAIESAVTLPGPSGPEPGWTFFMGLDAAVKRDWCSLCVVGKSTGHSIVKPSAEAKGRPHLDAVLVDLGLCSPVFDEQDDDYEHVPGTGRLRLFNVQYWRPPRGGQIDLAAVEQAVAEWAAMYGVALCVYDPTQAELIAQNSRKRGVRMSPFSSGQSVLTQLAGTLLESFASCHVDLYRHDVLLRQLGQLRIVERQTGGFRLDSPRNSLGHGDVAMSFALAMYGAKRFGGSVATLSRPLLHEGLALPNCGEPRQDFADDDDSLLLTDSTWDFRL